MSRPSSQSGRATCVRTPLKREGGSQQTCEINLLCSHRRQDLVWWNFLMCTITRCVVHHTWSLFKRSQYQYPGKIYGNSSTPSFHRAVFYILGFWAFVIDLIFPPMGPPCLPVLISLFQHLRRCAVSLSVSCHGPGEGPAPQAFPCSLWNIPLTALRVL